MGSEVGFSYVVLEVMVMFLKTFSEGLSSLANVFHAAVRACEAIYAALLVI